MYIRVCVYVYITFHINLADKNKSLGKILNIVYRVCKKSGQDQQYGSKTNRESEKGVEHVPMRAQ